MFYYLTRFAILLSYYVLGAYATTDITRLSHRNQTDIKNADCFCPSCHNKIKLTDQIPIFSYLFHLGKCPKCGAKIPIEDFLLELIIFSLCSVVTYLTGFRWISYFLIIFLYESIKIIYLMITGKKTEYFLKSICYSLFRNFIIFLIIASLFYMNQIVMQIYQI